MEFGTLDAIIGCVIAGLGITLLPYSVIAKHVKEEQLNYHPIPQAYGTVKTFFVYRKDKYISSSLKSFLDLLWRKESSVRAIINEYDLTPSSLDRWIQQDETSGSFKEKDNRSPEQQELLKLRKENKQLLMENDILKQAALIMGRK